MALRRRRNEDAELVAFGVGDHGPAFFACKEFGASTNEVVNVSVDVDMHAVLCALRLGNSVEPKRRTAFVDRIDGDGWVSFGSNDAYLSQRGEVFGRVWSDSIAEHLGPPVSKRPGICAVNADVLQT